MSHSSTFVSVASSMIRPRLLYVSTEDVRPYEDAQQVTVSLRDQIVAEDGFKLVYGVRSFGFDTDVMNISSKQKNNMLSFTATYLNSELIYNYNSGTVSANPNYNQPPQQKTFTIILNDANYGTIQSLFDEINFQISNIVDCGWLRDVTKPKDSPQNSIPFSFKFENPVPSQFIIDLNNITIDTLESYTVQDVKYAAFKFASALIQLTIHPTSGSPGLFNLLFTNKKSSIPDKPVCLPSFSLNAGQNPPDFIQFDITPSYYGTYAANPNDLSDNFVNVAENLVFYVLESPNEDLLNTENGIYPVPNYLNLDNLPYRSYHVPDLFPIYLDIKSTLENSNMTKEGLAKNLLARQFIVGSSNGNNSFLQNWDSPIYYILDSRSITSIELKFESEGDKWNFFNLQFALELIVFEVEEESSVPDFQEPLFVMPGDDPLTSAVNRYSNSVQNPMALVGSGQSKRMVYHNDILNRRDKKSRR